MHLKNYILAFYLLMVIVHFGCSAFFLSTSNYIGQIHLPLRLMDGLSIKCVIKKTFFIFHPNLMKLRKVLVQKVF